MNVSLKNLKTQVINERLRLIDESSRSGVYTDAELIKIGEAITQLRQLERDIFISDLDRTATNIGLLNPALVALTASINATSANLAAIATTIKNITDKIDAVLKSVRILTAIGLI